MNVDDFKKIGVVGAGVMGHGIVQVFAQAGYHVGLTSRTEKTLEQALRNIKSNLGLFVKYNLIKEDATKSILSRIETSVNLKDAVSDADFVVEAVLEDMDVKKSVFRSLDLYCPDHTILATNTSSLSVTEIGSATRRPEKVVGTHFWNPPHLMPLVEVMKGSFTSDETFQTACELMAKVGKVPAKILKDIPAGIANRIQVAMWREALALLDQNVATVEDIDKAVVLTFGTRLAIMGPLMTADLNGVDLILRVHDTLYKYIDRSLEPAEVLKKKVENGELGIKTGKGFYTWTKEKTDETIAKRDEGLINAFRPYLQKQLKSVK